MNSKSIITIIIAILLAFICSLFFMKKDTTPVSIYNENQEQVQKVILNEGQIKETEKELLKEAKSMLDKVSTKEDSLVENIVKKEELKSFAGQPVLDNVVQEASIVEEVPDYGIIKDENGNIIITRPFGKYQIKYSFRDFGIIDKVSTK